MILPIPMFPFVLLLFCLAAQAACAFKCDIVDLNEYKSMFHVVNWLAKLNFYKPTRKSFPFEQRKRWAMGNSSLTAELSYEAEIIADFRAMTFLKKFTPIDSRRLGATIGLPEFVLNANLTHLSVSGKDVTAIQMGQLNLSGLIRKPVVEVQVYVEFLRCPKTPWLDWLKCNAQTFLGVPGIVDVKSIRIEHVKVDFEDVEMDLDLSQVKYGGGLLKDSPDYKIVKDFLLQLKKDAVAEIQQKGRSKSYTEAKEELGTMLLPFPQSLADEFMKKKASTLCSRP